MKLRTKKILELMIFFYLSITSNLYAHNFINGGCQNHCESLINSKTKENRLIDEYDPRHIDINNSCLNKSLCRG